MREGVGASGEGEGSGVVPPASLSDDESPSLFQGSPGPGAGSLRTGGAFEGAAKEILVAGDPGEGGSWRKVAMCVDI